MKLEYLIEHMPEDIKRQTTHKVFLPGESLMRKGERATHVYLLTRGSTRVSNEFASGQRYTFASLDTPDLIGDLEVLSGQGAYAASNEAVTTCEVIAMSAETFLQWMRMDSEFALTVAQMLAAKMYPTSNEAGRVKFLPSLERLHSYLIKRLGTIEADTFILHTSRQQIADRAAQTGSMDETQEKIMRCFIGAHEEYPQMVFRTADELYGSFDGFIRDGLQITDSERETFRKLYLE